MLSTRSAAEWGRDKYDDGMAPLLRFESALRVLDDIAVLVGRAAGGGMRLGYGVISRLPVVGEVLRHGVDAIGDQLISDQIGPARRDVRRLVLQIVSSVLDEIDLTPLIRDRIDVNQVVELIDMDAVVQRIDVAPVVERIEIDDVVSRLDVDSVVAALDIDALVASLDLDAVVARLDIDELVARLDLDTIISRIDLIGLIAVMRSQVSLSALLRNSRNAVAHGVADSPVETRTDASIARVTQRVGGPSSQPRSTGTQPS